MIIFAENFGPLLGVVLLAPIILGVAARVTMGVLKGKRGQRPWWGLAIGVLAIVAGAAELLMFLTVRGGAPAPLYLVAVFPIIAGAGCLLVWNSKPRDD